MAEIFVTNLKSFVDDKTLRQLFGECGRVVAANVVRDRDGNSRRYGFVRFETRQSANEAVRSHSGRVFKGNVLIVEHKGCRGNRKVRHGFNVRSNCSWFSAFQSELEQTLCEISQSRI